MSDRLLQILPPEGVKIILTLFLCFLIGLEREEHRAEGQPGQRYSFGGVRAFPLIGLIGYAMSLLSGPELIPLTVGFGVIGAFLWLSYRHKLQSYKETGVTTELSGLATYVVGALVSRDQFWIATTLAILSMLLLELKDFLENLANKIPGQEIFTFTKFLLLTFVILPIVPDQGFTSFALNPYKTWLIVVAISGVSYGSYLLEKLAKGTGGIRLAALLGGAYSSTFTTFVMAKQSREAKSPHCYSGSILMASGVMYLRFLVLIALFNGELAHRLLSSFVALGALGILGGWAWSAIQDGGSSEIQQNYQAKNPLELATAFSLAVLFALFMVATSYAVTRLGSGGIYGMAAITGLAPVDPFIMGLTQTAGRLTPMGLAAGGVVVAAASNNFAKAIIAAVLGDSKTGRESLALLLGLTVLGLAPLFWVVR
ncbi:MAG TPA: MgtC/SapB family protein [Verrucomicrobiae bacterium]|nr:MgtC/SapB family protein [Verrucomicrobiae bacterium]